MRIVGVQVDGSLAKTNRFFIAPGLSLKAREVNEHVKVVRTQLISTLVGLPRSRGVALAEKNGTPSTHPLRGPEIRALRRLKRAYSGPYLFVTERGGPLTASTVRKLVARAGRKADIPFPVHPHMLRHATGFYLANEGRDTRSIQHYLGHKQIAHTVRYTELAPDRFKDFWMD